MMTHTPCSYASATLKQVTGLATKIHSDSSATSSRKWPREGAQMGQDVILSVQTVPVLAELAPRGEHRACVCNTTSKTTQ